MKKRKIKLLLISILLIFAISLTVFINTNNKYGKKVFVANFTGQIINHNKVIPEELLEYSRVKEQYENKDIVGMLKIPNAGLNEIVVQGEDNNYYLSHDINNNYDAYGTTFMDYRINLENSKKILIFGHNSSKRKTSFQELEKYYEEDYYKNHKTINLITNSEVRTYEIFSVYVEVSDWSYMNLNFEDDAKYYEHIKSLKNKSFYNTGVNVEKNDEVLILQTCSYHKEYSNYDKKYLLIISRRVE